MNTNDKLRELIRSPLSTGKTSAAGVTQADRALQILASDLEPYRGKTVGSLRIDMGEVQKILSLLDRQASIAQQAEEVARLRRIVKGWADWYRLADGDPDCEYLNGKGWDDAEALADIALAALRALNEQPVAEWQKGQI